MQEQRDNCAALNATLQDKDLGPLADDIFNDSKKILDDQEAQMPLIESGENYVLKLMGIYSQVFILLARAFNIVFNVALERLALKKKSPRLRPYHGKSLWRKASGMKQRKKQRARNSAKNSAKNRASIKTHFCQASHLMRSRYFKLNITSADRPD